MDKLKEELDKESLIQYIYSVDRADSVDLGLPEDFVIDRCLKLIQDNFVSKEVVKEIIDEAYNEGALTYAKYRYARGEAIPKSDIKVDETRLQELKQKHNL